jgi:hypothetical protein
MAGKGSKPRPFNVPKEEFDKSFETIFGKYVPPYLRKMTEDIPVLENEETWSQRVIDENSKDK